jgi:uncharacterized protein (TIGR03083 family)
MTIRDVARAERLAFADLLADLSPDEWGSPSWCDGWSVRDVAAHTIAYLGQSRRRAFVNLARAAGKLDTVNDRELAALAGASTHDLVEAMRAGVEPTGVAALYGCRVALIECLIHQQDIRRPLGRPRESPENAVRISLTYARASPVVGGARRTRGLRLVATDLDWSAGSGLEVRGPAEALLLAMTGRAARVSDQISGQGAAQLR